MLLLGGNRSVLILTSLQLNLAYVTAHRLWKKCGIPIAGERLLWCCPPRFMRVLIVGFVCAPVKARSPAHARPYERFMLGRV